MMKAVFLTLSAVLICTGCEERGAVTMEQYDAAHRLIWRELGDGSFFYRKASADDENKAYRCWQASDGAACIIATRSVSAGLRSLHVDAKTLPEMPAMDTDLIDTRNGYGCLDVLDTSEFISRDGHVLEMNSPKDDSAWSAMYVNRYMQENGVSGPKHFGCLRVLRAIQRGSLETLSTTSITRKIAGI